VDPILGLADVCLLLLLVVVWVRAVRNNGENANKPLGYMIALAISCIVVFILWN
jgi:hypothetical protein